MPVAIDLRPQPARDLVRGSPTASRAYPLGSASHSRSFDHRRRPEMLRTAIATAFFWPTSTTSFLPRVTPVVEEVPLQHGVVLGHYRDDDGGLLRALAFVNRRSIGRHQRVEFAKAVSNGTAVKAAVKLARLGVYIVDVADVAVLNSLS